MIYAQTEEYTYGPFETTPHHDIAPQVSNFEMVFLNTNEVESPSIPEEGSKLDFDKLTPYSNVAIKFTFIDFASAAGADNPTVSMLVYLNILTLGRFDYTLTYVSGGDDDVIPIGNIGLFSSMAMAIGAGFSGLMDGLGGLGEAFTGPLVAIAVIVVVVFAAILIIRYMMMKRATKMITG